MQFMLWILAGLGVIVLSILGRVLYNKLLRKLPGAAVRFGKAWGQRTDRYVVLRSLNTFFYLTGMAVVLVGIILAINGILRAAKTPPPPPTPAAIADSVLEADEIFRLVNAERERAGVPPLKQDNRLAGIAQARVDDMATRQYYAHQNPDGKYYYDLFPEYLIAADYSCENLDVEFTVDENRYVQDWLNSTKGHRECLLSGETTTAGFAVGLFNQGDGQKIYIVVGIHSSSLSVAEPPRAKTERSLLP